jgi:SAM-dependent methyltransferase
LCRTEQTIGRKGGNKSISENKTANSIIHFYKSKGTMSDFYDQLAPYYHLLYEDWDASIAAQGELLDNIIQSEWGPSANKILDVSCGIGTQCLALASREYEVTGSDLSPGAVARASKEAVARHLSISFSVSDMRNLEIFHESNFDIVISAGNAIPHLLSDNEIVGALKEMYACLRPGGGCLLTTRQYDQEERGKAIFKPFGVRDEGDHRYIIFQVWDFEDDQYDFAMYFIKTNKQSDIIDTFVGHSRYYAVSPVRLLELMKLAGFVNVKRLDDAVSPPAIIVGSKLAKPT